MLFEVGLQLQAVARMHFLHFLLARKQGSAAKSSVGNECVLTGNEMCRGELQGDGGGKAGKKSKKSAKKANKGMSDGKGDGKASENESAAASRTGCTESKDRGPSLGAGSSKQLVRASTCHGRGHVCMRSPTQPTDREAKRSCLVCCIFPFFRFRCSCDCGFVDEAAASSWVSSDARLPVSRVPKAAAPEEAVQMTAKAKKKKKGKGGLAAPPAPAGDSEASAAAACEIDICESRPEEANGLPLKTRAVVVASKAAAQKAEVRPDDTRTPCHAVSTEAGVVNGECRPRPNASASLLEAAVQVLQGQVSA
eukprot:6175730-Pleurochrysis_carterae.AAC.3